MSTDFICPACGLDFATISPPDAKVAIRSFGRRYRSALAGAVDDQSDAGLVRRRSDPAVWSALEYTVHVAEVFEFLTEAIRRMYDEHEPALEAIDFEGRVISERYAEADPMAALDRLDAAASALAAQVDRIDADGWHREATFPFGRRDILTMTRNAVHEGSHHLRDVERALDSARRVP